MALHTVISVGSTPPEDTIRGCEASYLKAGWEPSLFVGTKGNFSREVKCPGLAIDHIHL